MKIALIGYGKMGHIIEKIAIERGHQIVCTIDKDNREEIFGDAFKSADCAIEFSTPGTALENIRDAFAGGVPVVCGTTGWLDSLPDIKAACADDSNTFLFASNFSIGVNIFMALNRYLGKIMNNFPQYTPALEEIHHIHKLDHPSGTAVTLADELLSVNSNIRGWQETCENPQKHFNSERNIGKVMKISHTREGEVPGIHTITWDSSVDGISITHNAKSREGFALGAVIAAEWLANKKGFHTISEVFDF